MDPIAFKIGGFAIYWYGILVAGGFLIGLWTASRRAARDGIDGKVVSDLGVWIIIAALLGSRVLYVITNWGEFSDKPFSDWIDFRSGGLVFYGGFIGAALAVILYTRIHGSQPLWKIADAFAPSVPLGHALGRLGCLMYGCCFGATCDLPWAIQFPANSPAFNALGQATGLALNKDQTSNEKLKFLKSSTILGFLKNKVGNDPVSYTHLTLPTNREV